MIKQFSHPTFINKKVFYVDDFHDCLVAMAETAAKYKLQIYVISTVRYPDIPVKGAIVTPAKKSNHFVGCAIDCNIKEGKVLWTSKMLETPGGNVKKFIQEVKDRGVRWGGDFAKKDTIHFDNAMNIKNPKRYKEIFKEIHGV